jgi:hypothetical protein
MDRTPRQRTIFRNSEKGDLTDAVITVHIFQRKIDFPYIRARFVKNPMHSYGAYIIIQFSLRNKNLMKGASVT